MIKGWKYYNHSLLPTSEPHEDSIAPPTLVEVLKNDLFSAIMARWTTDFDCGYETNWWYIIKDTPLDISTLKAKRRYEINKGIKNFRVERINPENFSEELYTVEVDALSAWPEKYRPKVERDFFLQKTKNWRNAIVFGGFDKETNELCAYAFLQEYTNHLEFSMLRAKPKSEKKAINAAMVYAILESYGSKLHDGYYINDGQRSVLHETAFQDYLEKYFEFRKAYCRMHIKWYLPIPLMLSIMRPIKPFLSDDNRIKAKMNSLEKMMTLAVETNTK